ncbi:MAG: hypothetical protein JJT76_12805 [Clostridiaceae bacterium]|nr:hypothetical protein [Clostridiaceae bacterium]
MPEIKLPSAEQFDTMNEYLAKIANTRVQEDYSNAPGGKFLLAGDRQAGFFGFVPASELITGNDLALEIGLTSGTSLFSDSPWIKYIWKGKVCFTPVKPLRHSPTWNAIYNAGAVYASGNEGTLPPGGRIGSQLSIDASDNSINTTTNSSDAADGFLRSDAAVASVGDTVVLKGFSNSANNGEFTVDSITANKIILSGGNLVNEQGGKTSRIYKKNNAVTQNRTVVIDGLTYKVRLMRGAADDPTDSYNDSDRGSVGPDNEWNGIILPLHERAKLQNWNYPQYAGQTDYWDVNLTDEDMVLHHTFGSGSYRWCQEARDGEESYRRVGRGYYGASGLVATNSWSVNSSRAWAPVLELLG